ncbi:MAG TPA: hypothetical protein VGI60_06660 [Chthoniobacterales bacterium]
MAGDAVGFRLTGSFVAHQLAQISDGHVDFFEVAPAALLLLAIDLAHERDHIAQIAYSRLGQISFLGALVGPGGDFVQLRFQAAKVGVSGATQGPTQPNEIGK